MDPVVWIAVGLGVGALAPVLGRPYGLFADLVFGLLGAFAGGWIGSLVGTGTLSASATGALFGAVALVLTYRLLLRAGASAPTEAAA